MGLSGFADFISNVPILGSVTGALTKTIDNADGNGASNSELPGADDDSDTVSDLANDLSPSGIESWWNGLSSSTQTEIMEIAALFVGLIILRKII